MGERVNNAPVTFAQKLDFVLKVLSLSRGRLASTLGVDKSLVSRWVSGSNIPTAHNLSALTALVAGRRAGFTLLDWERDLQDLASLFGVAPPDPTEDPQNAFLGASRGQSLVEVEREGRAYPGVYVGFRQALRNSGDIVPDLIIIHGKDNRLFFRQCDPVFAHSGEILILRHQLFLVSEDDGRVDGLACYILNGPTGGKAIRIDGLVMSVAGDRHRTPSASPVVLHRLMDLDNDAAAPVDDLIADILARLRAAYEAGEVAALAGPKVADAVFPIIGHGAVDHLLRAPQERSLAVSEINWTAEIEADTRRLRRALLDVDDCYPVFSSHEAARMRI